VAEAAAASAENNPLEIEANPLETETNPLETETNPLENETNPLENETNPLENETTVDNAVDGENPTSSDSMAANAADPGQDDQQPYEHAEDPVGTPEEQPSLEQQVEMQMSVEAEPPMFQPDTSYNSLDVTQETVLPDSTFAAPEPMLNTSWHSVMEPAPENSLVDLDAITAAASDSHTQGIVSQPPPAMNMPETPPKATEALPQQIFY